MAAADYRLMTEATGQRIAIALEHLAGFGAYLTTSDVVNNLTSTATDKPGSANMLKTLNDKIKQFATVSGTHTFSCNAQTWADAGAETYSAPEGFTRNDIISIDAYVDGVYWARCVASRANNNAAIAFMVWNNTAITNGTINYRITFMK